MTSSKIIEVMARGVATGHYARRLGRPVDDQNVVLNANANWNIWAKECWDAYAALQASGMAVVPVEPNNTVVTAGCFALDGPAAREALMAAMLSGDRHAVGQTKMRLRWAAMLSASPNIKAPDREGEQDG